MRLCSANRVWLAAGVTSRRFYGTALALTSLRRGSSETQEAEVKQSKATCTRHLSTTSDTTHTPCAHPSDQLPYHLSQYTSSSSPSPTTDAHDHHLRLRFPAHHPARQHTNEHHLHTPQPPPPPPWPQNSTRTSSISPGTCTPALNQVSAC